MACLCLWPYHYLKEKVVVILGFPFVAFLASLPADLPIIYRFDDDFYDVSTFTWGINCSEFSNIVSNRFSSSPAISYRCLGAYDMGSI